MGKSAELSLADLDQKTQVATKAEYEQELEELQTLMLRIQAAVYQQKRRVLLVFEGCDAAGKGGAIRRLTEKLDPRGFSVHPISAPRPDEQGRHYLYRFWRRLPKPGQIAIFDRSWYGRVLVEKIEGFASKDEVKRSYDEINAFEKMLTDDGALIVKVYLHITEDEQLERFAERISNPYKRWKIGAEDVRNRQHWADYVEAADEMFAKTSNNNAPWHLVPGNHKWHARLQVMRIITGVLEDEVDLTQPLVDLDKLTEIAKDLGLKKLLPLKHE